jgi:hypothetical protein
VCKAGHSGITQAGRGYHPGMAPTPQPFHLYCSIHADDPDELARVLREIAAEINIQRDEELAGEVLFDADSDTRSSWHFSVAMSS